MALYKVIICPLDISERICQLTAFLIRFCVIYDRPAKHSCRICHGKVKLYVVSRIIPAAGKVQAVVLTVIKCRVASPVTPYLFRKLAGTLKLVEKYRLLQGFAVIILTCTLGTFVATAGFGELTCIYDCYGFCYYYFAGLLDLGVIVIVTGTGSGACPGIIIGIGVFLCVRTCTFIIRTLPGIVIRVCNCPGACARAIFLVIGCSCYSGSSFFVTARAAALSVRFCIGVCARPVIRALTVGIIICRGCSFAAGCHNICLIPGHDGLAYITGFYI